MLNKVLKILVAVKNFLKGKKIYLAALILILQAAAGYLEQIADFSSLTDFISWCGSLGGNEFTSTLLEGLGLFGLRFAFGGKQNNSDAKPTSAK